MSDEISADKMRLAEMLCASRRYDEAAALLMEVLATDPENAFAHYRMATTLDSMEGNKKREALEASENAIKYDAEESHYFALHSQLSIDLDKVKQGHESADQAIILDPDNGSGYIAKAICYMKQNQWSNAEQQLRTALTLDADDEAAGNLLAHVLRMQNKMADTEQTIDGLLSDNPEDAYAHYNAGWAALQNNDSSKAEEHFSEALRLDPEFDPAREGLIESFKSRSAFYRAYLQYCFFMQRFTDKAGWAIVIGLLVGVRVGRTLLEKLHPIASTALVAVYFIFILWVWLASGIGSLFLLMDRRARLALKKSEKIEGIAVGGAFVVGLVLVFAGLLIGAVGVSFTGAFLALSAMPASLTYTNPSKYGKILFGSITVLFYLVLLASAGSAVMNGGGISEAIASLFWIAMLVAMGCTWIGNIPKLRQPNY